MNIMYINEQISIFNEYEWHKQTDFRLSNCSPGSRPEEGLVPARLRCYMAIKENDLGFVHVAVGSVTTVTDCRQNKRIRGP